MREARDTYSEKSALHCVSEHGNTVQNRQSQRSTLQKKEVCAYRIPNVLAQEHKPLDYRLVSSMCAERPASEPDPEPVAVARLAETRVARVRVPPYTLERSYAVWVHPLRPDLRGVRGGRGAEAWLSLAGTFWGQSL